MRARIYQPTKTAMQSGTAKSRGWVLEFVNSTGRDVDPLMGWTSDYAKDNGIEATLTSPNIRKPVIRPGGYGENFATGRRGVWTH